MQLLSLGDFAGLRFRVGEWDESQELVSWVESAARWLRMELRDRFWLGMAERSNFVRAQILQEMVCGPGWLGGDRGIPWYGFEIIRHLDETADVHGIEVFARQDMRLHAYIAELGWRP